MTLHDVVAVRPLGGYRLWLRFDDGVEGEVDFATAFDFRGIFAELRDPARFADVRVDPELGTIAWPNGADVDPVVLYHWATGVPLPAWAAGAQSDAGRSAA